MLPWGTVFVHDVALLCRGGAGRKRRYAKLGPYVCNNDAKRVRFHDRYRRTYAGQLRRIGKRIFADFDLRCGKRTVLVGVQLEILSYYTFIIIGVCIFVVDFIRKQRRQKQI